MDRRNELLNTLSRSVGVDKKHHCSRIASKLCDLKVSCGGFGGNRSVSEHNRPQVLVECNFDFNNNFNCMKVFITLFE